MNNTTPKEEQEIDLRDYLEVLFQRKWIIISLFVVIVLTAGIVTYKMTPVYEASASLLIEGPAGEGAMFAELVGGLQRDPGIPSQVKIIKSRTIAEEVVRDIRYDQRVYGASEELNLEIANLEISDEFIGDTFIVKFSDDDGNFIVTRIKGDGLNLFERLINFLDKGRAGAETTEIGSGIIDTPFKCGSGLSFEIKEAAPYSGASFRMRRVEFSDAVRSLQGSLSVTAVGGADIVNIRFQNSCPEMAADIANSIAKQYIAHDILQRGRESAYIMEFVDQQLEPTEKHLGEALEALARHKKESEVVLLREGTKKLMEKIGGMEREMISLILKERQIRYLYDKIRGDLTDISILRLSAIEDPMVHSMVIRFTTLKDRKRSLLDSYTERHPQVVALTSEVNELKRRISPAVLNALHSTVKERDGLKKELSELRRELEALPHEEKRLTELTLAKDISFNIHTFLLQKLNEAAIIQASTIPSIRIIDLAIAPDNPIKPNKELNMLLAAIIGLMFGVGLAFFINYLDNSIKSPRDVEGRLGLSIFGKIPISLHKGSNPGLITLDSIKSVEAESYRSLRTNLQFAALGKKEKRGKIFHITSPESAEGKTTTTANLGIVLAQMGSKTLIIDMDMRKPKIHHTFGINKEPGMVNLLTGKAKLNEIVSSANIEHLYLIPVGITPPNPSELLSQQNLSDLLDSIREEFDYILIDSPPVLPVTDAQILGRLADATLLVVKMGTTIFDAVEQSIKQLQTVEVSVAGAILNMVPLSSKYGYYQYYHKDD